MYNPLICPCCNKDISHESGEVNDGKLTFTCDGCLTVIPSEELNIVTISPTMSPEVIGQALADQIRREGGNAEDLDTEELARFLKEALKYMENGE